MSSSFETSMISDVCRSISLMASVISNTMKIEPSEMTKSPLSSRSAIGLSANSISESACNWTEPRCV